MVELSPIEQMIVKALEDLGATKEQALKTADDVAKKTSRPKSMITNSLIILSQKGVIKRVAREKAAGYYLLKQAE